MSERDTQFAGFAKLLWEEVVHNVNHQRDYLVNAEILKQEEIQIIAQRAYDLVGHVLCSVQMADIECCEYRDELVPTIPDMTKWPEVTS